MAISDIASTDHQPLKRGPDCSVCQALLELPEADAEGLLALLSDKRRRWTEIQALVSQDEDTPQWVRDIHHSTYRRHAKGGCAARVNLR